MPTKTLFTASAPFQAARHLDAFPVGHRSRRLHGHGFLASVRCDPPRDWAPFRGGEVERLRESLAATVARLDYRLLNDQLPQPTDEGIARWLRSHVDIPGVERIGIRSTPNRGVDLDDAGSARAWRRYAFESAHRLPNVPPGHKCRRLHGHGFEVVVHADRGERDPIDHDRLDALWAPLHAELDHACLNDLPGLDNPTSEILSSWLWTRLKRPLPELNRIAVYETPSCGASFDGERYRIWKEMRLDSALQLRHAPEQSRLRRIHGHTYTLRLNLSGALDDVMGWTIDFGDVRRLFDPLFDALDHRPLHEIADLDDCDTAGVARWILDRATGKLPALDRVDLYETPGCGAIVRR